MKTLDEKEIIKIMREEWESRLNSVLLESDDSTTDINNAEILSQGLKLLHKKSKIRYTVKSVSARDAILTTPEGKDFLVKNDTLEKEYELD